MSKVLLIGCGFMGRAIAQGWMKQPSLSLIAVDPDEANRHLAESFGAVTFTDLNQLNQWAAQQKLVFDIVLVAIKPQLINAVLPSYHDWMSEGTTVVSLAAGINLEALEAVLPVQTAIVRCMPNMPASVGAGVIACTANKQVNQSAQQRLSEFMQANGDVIWLESEEQIDIVTAISGSGPAYYFYMTQCLEHSAQRLGLEPQLAAKLARATFNGSALLASVNGHSMEHLQQSITSAKGTTEAGVSVLSAKELGLQRLLDRTTQAARDRAQALSAG